MLTRLLPEMTNSGARTELALSIARILGEEGHFIELLRHARQDLGTAAAQELAKMQRRWARRNDVKLTQEFRSAANAFAHEDLSSGAAHLAQIASLVCDQVADDSGKLVLAMCATHLAEYGAEHPEYILLTLHTLAIPGER